MIRSGINTGDTFTDLIAFDDPTRNLTVAKLPWSRSNPARSITGVVQESGLQRQEISSLVLGAALSLRDLRQRRWTIVFVLTTRAFQSVPFIMRMNRRHHYYFGWKRLKPLLERRTCLGVGKRLDSKAKVRPEEGLSQSWCFPSVRVPASNEQQQEADSQ